MAATTTTDQRKRVLETLEAKSDDFLYAFGRWYHNPEHLNVWEPVKEQMVRLIIRDWHREHHKEELWKNYKGEILDLLKDASANTISLTHPHLEHTPFDLKTAEPLKGRCWNDQIHWIDNEGTIHTRPTDLKEFWPHRIRDNFPTPDSHRNDMTLYDTYADQATAADPADEEHSSESHLNYMLMLEVLGMVLSDNRFQKMVHCGKTPNSGKSTFLRIAELLVGEENSKPVKAHRLDTDQSLPARLVGKMLITAPEMAAQPSAHTNDFIKAATGGDRMEMRRLYEQDALDAPITGIFIAASNRTTSYVGFNEKPDAMRRRLICIPFDNALQGRPDTDLAQNIIDQCGDALRLAAIQAYAAVVEAGGEFSLSKASKSLTEEMCMAPYGEFASFYEHAKGEFVLNRDIREHYEDWHGVKIENDKTFGGIRRALANIHDGDLKKSIKIQGRVQGGIRDIQRIPDGEIELEDEF